MIPGGYFLRQRPLKAYVKLYDCTSDNIPWNTVWNNIGLAWENAQNEILC